MLKFIPVLDPHRIPFGWGHPGDIPGGLQPLRLIYGLNAPTKGDSTHQFAVTAFGIILLLIRTVCKNLITPSFFQMSEVTRLSTRLYLSAYIAFIDVPAG